MTEKETIEHIIATRRFPRTVDDNMNYFFLIAPIAFTAIGSSMMYNYVVFESGPEILIDSILIFSLGILFAFFILRRLSENITFTSITATSDDNIDSVSENLKQKFNLRSVDVDKDLNRIAAFTKTTAFSWGEQLTLVFDKDCIFINSRPSGSRQPFTILKDRRNIKKLEE